MMWDVQWFDYMLIFCACYTCVCVYVLYSFYSAHMMEFSVVFVFCLFFYCGVWFRINTGMNINMNFQYIIPNNVLLVICYVIGVNVRVLCVRVCVCVIISLRCV